MRFKKTHEKHHPDKIYWVAASDRKGQTVKPVFYIITPKGRLFELSINVDWRGAKKIHTFEKFESAKTVANLFEKG